MASGGRLRVAKLQASGEALAPLWQFRGLVGDPRQTFEGGRQLVRLQVDAPRGQEGALDVVAALLVTAFHRSQEARGRLTHPLRFRHQGAGGKVVHQGRGRLEEQRQVVLQSAGGAALGDLAVDQAALGVTLDLGAVALAEGAHRLVAQGELPRRKQADAGHLLPGALGVRVEGADALHLVVEEVDAVGLQAPHGEDVQERAAHGELAMGDDLRDALVAGPLQAAAGLGQVKALADTQDQRVPVHVVLRGQALQQGAHRDHQDPAGQLREAVQRQESLGDQLRQGEKTS